MEFSNQNVQKKILILFCVLSFLLQAYSINSGFGFFLIDDSYYYFQIAKNFPKFHQWTFDGIHLTNGVQPLYAAILCIVSWTLSPLALSPENLAKAFYLLNAVMNVAAAVAFFSWGKRLGGISFAWLLFMFFGFGHFTLHRQLGGMENSLYAMMLGICLPRILSITNAENKITFKKGIIVGICFGLLFLTRVDTIFLMIIVVVWSLIKRLKMKRPFIKELGFIIFISFVTVFPYLVYNLKYFSHLFPISGAVKSYHSKQYALSNFDGMFTVNYLLFTGKTILLVSGKLLTETVKFFTSWFFGYPFINKAFFMSFNIPFIAISIIVVSSIAGKWYYTAKSVRSEAVQRFFSIMSPVIPLFLFALVQLIISSFMYPLMVNYAGIGWWYVPSYISLAYIVITFLYCLIFFSRKESNLNQKSLLLLLTLICINSFVYLYVKSITKPLPIDLNGDNPMYNASKWMNGNLPPKSVVGCFSAGTIGYYSDHVVIGLDGLVNDYNYLDIVKNKKLYSYLIENNITYIADYQKNSQKVPENYFYGIPIQKVVYSKPFELFPNSIYIVSKLDNTKLKK